MLIGCSKDENDQTTNKSDLSRTWILQKVKVKEMLEDSDDKFELNLTFTD